MNISSRPENIFKTTFFRDFQIFQDCRIILTSAESWASPKLMENFSFVVFNGTDNLSYFNFTGKQLFEAKRAILSFNIKKKSEAARKDYDVEVFSSNVDSCQAGKGIFGNFIIKFFLTNFEQYSNLKIECPQKKGFYYAYNFPMPKDLKSFLPSFMRIPSSFWQLTIDVRAKVVKSRAPARVYQIQIKGESIHDDHA